mmetsp:Transcript_25739/g.40304  ORF Transcript_25739/g.40304 Transcript_25739/m.40304 type:complete len:200 (+) Transcript_25739:37-636(+)|eukprot:CAMPEP_0184291242 /NCGR_PEP_ID=MMETSP1049-20130417/3317_1 /TAXON_ID=77928 /ORGANISM="Proteomonas sulcata, Strain CCMP704" /LENGTH=199 /DNA_ID=CAMNT_0026598633 /DNA_START=55 /DNA_END=654 /DNA_ORIENTATION=+
MVVLRSLGLVLALVALASALPVREKDDNPICKECKQMITALQGVMIKANQTYEVSLKKYLDKNLCNQLPADYTEDCKDIVDDELPAIWEEIIDDVLNPTLRCADLDLCPNPDNLKMEADFRCDICTKVTRYIGEKVLEDPKVEKRVALRLKKICDDIPDIDETAKAKCKEIVAADTPEAMKQIGQEIAEDLCKDAQLCP